MANLAITDNLNLCKNNYYYALTSEFAPTPPQNILPSHTGIADSGATVFYFAPDAPVTSYNPQAPTVGVRVANGRPERSVASATLASVPSLPQASMTGHVMPAFPHTLIGLGPFADLGLVAKLCSPNHQSQSITPTAIPFSQAGGMKLDHASGTSRSPRKPHRWP
jgi:hypothetical protein